MATKIPPHNLTEIVDATITLVNNPDAQLAEILKFVQGPDFPTAGIIHGRGGIVDAYKNGRGRFMMRAKAGIETFNKDRKAIVITEIPYQVNKARLVERIAQLVNDKIVDTISDIRDESDRDGMRIVVELKRDGEPQLVLNQLFKHTQMQESFSMILLAVVNNQPKEMGLVQAIKHFIDHRVDVVRRRTAYLLSKAKDREHILEGYLTALDHLDNVITIIRASANRAEARENLVAYFAGKKIDINVTGRAPKRDPEKPFTGIQADAILELQLHRLTKLSIDEITKELNVTREHIAEYESILGSEKKLRAVIVKELEEVKKLYGDDRRTVIEDEAAEIHLEDLIADEQVAVTVSHGGYMKRTPVSTYRMQRRGGTGRTGMKTRDEDFVEHLFIDSTHAYILIFTNTGRVYWLKVYEIPDVSAAGKGKHVGNLVGLQPGETVRTMLTVRNLEEVGKYIFFATRNGLVKKTELKDFSPRALERHLRHQHRAGRRTGRGQSHRRPADRVPGHARRPGHPLRRRRCPPHGPPGIRCLGHPHGKGRLPGRHGDNAQGRCPGESRSNESARDGCPGSRPGAGKRQTDSLRHRKRLRQTHRCRRIPPAGTRRLRRHQRENHGTQRQSRRHRAGNGEIRSHADQPVRQNHPHGFNDHPRIRPRRTRRALVASGAGRPRGGGSGSCAGRRAG